MPLCKAAAEEGLQLSGGRCQNKPVPGGSPETREGAGPARPGGLPAGITEPRSGGLEAPGPGALATGGSCPHWSHMLASALRFPEGEDGSCLNPEHGWPRSVLGSPQGQQEVACSLALHRHFLVNCT